MDSKSPDDPQSHRPILLFRKGTCYLCFEHRGAIEGRFDVGIGTKLGIVLNVRPEAVEGEDPGYVIRDFIFGELRDGVGDHLENATLLNDGDALEGLHIVGMDGEQIHEIIHALVPIAVEPGKRLEVGADLLALSVGLFKETVGDDKFHIGCRDVNLLKAVFDPSQTFGGKGKSSGIEDRLLDAGEHSKTDGLADFAYLTQKAEIEDELLPVAAAEIVEQFVDREEEPVVGIDLVERCHHVLQRGLVFRHLVSLFERVINPDGGEVFGKSAGQNLAERHGRGADLHANDLESTREARR